ncbi:MAG: ABC transporter substrate-binding protein [Chloroflexi bacterium]|nr:ABC transporter substrate-binding protein [Chloroflexota bacterium]
MKRQAWSVLLPLLTLLAIAGCAPTTTNPIVTAPTLAATTSAPQQATAQKPASPSQTAPQAASGGTLVRAMTSEPGQIDPQGAPNSGLSLVIPYLFDTLVVRDADNKLVPLLADSWQVSDDGKAITMKLKAGVTFQDGTPLDAQAVQATFQRFKQSGTKSPIYADIKQIAGIDVVDNSTVRFTFKEPTATFWSTISLPYAGIVSPASIKQVAESGKGNLIGSGPFMLGEWKAGQSITLKRNPAYHWGAPITQNQGAPYLESMVYKVIPDATTQLAALEAGDVDAIFINQPDHRQKLQANSSIRLQDAVLNSMIYLGYNCKKAPFDDVKVRQALSHAIDKDEILNLALGGIGMIAHAPLPPSLPGYDNSLKTYELGFDKSKAQALLKEAGFSQSSDGTWAKNGQTLQGVLLTSNRAPNDAIAALIQSELKAIGVSVEIQQLDSKAVMDATNKGKFDLLLWRYDWNDPDALNIYLGSNQIGSTNRVFYSNPDVDKLLAQGDHELNETKRIQLYLEAQKIILQDAPWQPLYVPLDVLAINKRVEGAKIGYMGRLLVNDVRVANQ